MLERMYRDHRGLLEKAAMRYMNGNSHDAEELLQETWLFVSSRADTLCFPNERAECSYLLTVLKNRARDMWKSLRRREQSVTSLEENEMDLPATDFLPDALVTEQDVLSRVCAAIRSMPTKDREVLTLILLNECTVRQAAEAIGCTEEAANSRYYRARKRLAEKLRKVGIQYDETE